MLIKIDKYFHRYTKQPRFSSGATVEIHSVRYLVLFEINYIFNIKNDPKPYRQKNETSNIALKSLQMQKRYFCIQELFPYIILGTIVDWLFKFDNSRKREKASFKLP